MAYPLPNERGIECDFGVCIGRDNRDGFSGFKRLKVFFADEVDCDGEVQCPVDAKRIYEI
ncbi:hypothetical protein G7066_04445 [Leucobacter coleopterorum]|uniref:Uncharacterized protein n=1 Tax=Leucobacter coleopterorum TaxID=2714933 RepID=A0ABX6JYS9_9MICO|nr:hypothetical protein [Leucobacter coleopterorum]QIM18094.1 hypothetical protein G7066_04445 [Leucobacter coleopterorum]